MIKKTSIFACVCLVLTSFGCGWIRQSKIQSELDDLRPKKAVLQMRLDGAYKRYESLLNQSNKLTSDLKANHNAAMALLRDNPGTVACIASGTVALSEGNVFSDDAKELGAAVGLFCLGVYIFSEDFQKSADHLVSEINKASSREKTIQSQINGLKPQLAAETRNWQVEKQGFDELSNQISKLEDELTELQR
ncbi:MAG: hypothetical protein IPL32_03425 [Chloracidobacterium sp.]|nr:hypothetical protein [Chloracidobacterium sp.]